MKLKGAGRSLMAAGVACIIIYVLASLYGLSATALRVGKVLLYVGIVIIVIGLAVRLLRPRA
jgi:uncharacterized membrane protein YtjA (UPF0391 family)